MLRLTFLLCSGLFLVMLVGGRDFGQLRPGLVRAEAEAKAAPVAVAVPVVETAALAADMVPDLAMPVVVAAVVAPAVVVPVVPAPAVVALAPAPVVEQADTGVFTLATYADAAAATDAPVTPEASADGEIWYVAGNALNVRAGPSTDDAVVGKLTRGEATLVVWREGEDWARIRIEGDGIEGYVAMRFLTAEVPAVN